MNVIEILSLSGPLPVEDLIWRSDVSPEDALGEIADMADKGLLRLSGIGTKDLRDLATKISPDADLLHSTDLALEKVHAQLSTQEVRAELTRQGLRSVSAVY